MIKTFKQNLNKLTATRPALYVILKEVVHAEGKLRWKQKTIIKHTHTHAERILIKETISWHL